MTYSLRKSWDNRGYPVRMNAFGRTWVRRIRWYENGTVTVKLKFEDSTEYVEAGVTVAFAQTVWDRFKSGQSIQDSLSVFGCEHVVLSRRGAEGGG